MRKMLVQTGVARLSFYVDGWLKMEVHPRDMQDTASYFTQRLSIWSCLQN